MCIRDRVKASTTNAIVREMDNVRKPLPCLFLIHIWAPSVGAWQRQLTDNAIRAADRLECIKPLSIKEYLQAVVLPVHLHTAPVELPAGKLPLCLFRCV